MHGYDYNYSSLKLNIINIICTTRLTIVCVFLEVINDYWRQYFTTLVLKLCNILCFIVFQEDRFEILQALSRSMNFSPDVDLHSLAAMCEHFTGADIKALLYNAQLNALNGDPAFAAISSGTIENTFRGRCAVLVEGLTPLVCRGRCDVLVKGMTPAWLAQLVNAPTQVHVQSCL